MSERVIRIAVRVLVAVIAIGAAAVAILAFEPGHEIHYEHPVEIVIRSAGGGFVAVPVIALALPGLAAWRWPRPWILWSWAAVAATASGIALAFIDHVPAGAEELWAAGAVEIGAWGLAALATLGPLLAGFAIHAAQVTYGGEAPRLAARLRRLVVVIAGIGLVLALVAFLPGQRVYDDANHCVGQAFASLAGTEHAHASCTPSYTELRATRHAGGLPLVVYVVLLLAPAAALYRAPSARGAWWWVVWGVAALAASVVLWVMTEFHLDLFSSTTELWPAAVAAGGVALIQGLLLIGVPLVIVTSREPRGPSLPRARAIERV